MEVAKGQNRIARRRQAALHLQPHHFWHFLKTEYFKRKKAAHGRLITTIVTCVA